MELEHEYSEDWTLSEERPGYHFKTLRHKYGTINVYSPILTPEEAARRENQVKSVISSVMSNFYNRQIEHYRPFLEEQGIKLTGSVTPVNTYNGEEEFQLKVSTSILTHNSSLILNDHMTKELIVISIPVNMFSVKSNGAGDLLTFEDDPEFLDLNINGKTLKDRETGTDFSPCLVARIPYEYSNDKYILRSK